MRDDILIQRPDATPAAPQLLLLFHGVGSSAENMRPLGEALAALRPQAFVVSVRSPDASDLGQGWQWFPVQGMTEANRPERVAAAMPRFEEQAVLRRQPLGRRFRGLAARRPGDPPPRTRDGTASRGILASAGPGPDVEVCG